jgi:hypothetical protein
MINTFQMFVLLRRHRPDKQSRPFDVSVAFAKERNPRISRVHTDKLIACIFNVNRDFVESLRKPDSATNADKLVAFHPRRNARNGGLLHQFGYQPDVDTLIAMRIHGVSTEFMEQLKRMSRTTSI